MARRKKPSWEDPKPWHADAGGTGAQRRYLQRGIDQPDGKLPLFDEYGQEIPKVTIRTCIEHGWAEPWSRHPIHPDWVLCRLTDAGFLMLGLSPARRKSMP
jgi:hypothetical protein